MFKKIKKNLVSISVISTSVIAIISSVVAFNVYGKDYVLNASKDTHTAIIRNVADFKKEYHTDKCSRLKNEWFIAKGQAETYPKGKVPAWITEKIVDLETQISKIKNCKIYSK